MSVVFFRDGIIATPAERVATENTPKGEKSAFYQTEPANCFKSISGAGWCKTAARRKKRGEPFSVEVDQYQRDSGRGEPGSDSVF